MRGLEGQKEIRDSGYRKILGRIGIRDTGYEKIGRRIGIRDTGKVIYPMGKILREAKHQ